MAEDSRHNVSRRAFIATTVGARRAHWRSRRTNAQPVETSAPTVDQNPIRRRGVGLRGLDPARACPGLTLFAPAGGTEVHLIDLHGAVAHTWKTPYRPGLYGYLTDRGTLFYNGQIPERNVPWQVALHGRRRP